PPGASEDGRGRAHRRRDRHRGQPGPGDGRRRPMSQVDQDGRVPAWQTGQLAPLRVAPVDVPGPVLSEADREEAARIVARYPDGRSALVPLLYLVQSVVGWVPRQGMREVADILGLRTAEVEAVATFYTMLKLRPCGRYVLSVCTNPSCSLLGGRRVYERAKELLGPAAEQ